METRTITKEQVIQAPPDRVFAALTTKQELERWFVPKVDVELKPGGSFSMEWAPGMGERGHVTAVKASEVFGFTWEVFSPTPTTVTFALKAHRKGTLLTLTHGGIGHGDGWQIYATIDKAWGAHLNDLTSWVETGTCPPPGPRG
jgi:uncharacterized protein YndB with AHSA1/START domain